MKPLNLPSPSTGSFTTAEGLLQHLDEQNSLALARAECAYRAYMFGKTGSENLDPVQAVLFDVLDQLREMKATTEDARSRGIIS